VSRPDAGNKKDHREERRSSHRALPVCRTADAFREARLRADPQYEKQIWIDRVPEFVSDEA